MISRDRSPALFSGGLLIAALCACQGPAPDSVLVTNALIVDGNGADAYRGAVRIADGRIAEIGDLHALGGEVTIDALGKVLAPGFIDTHSHHDSGMDGHRDMLAVVSQGVTTIVRGADGDSGLEEAYAYLPQADFNRQFEAAPAAVNVASFSPHGSIRHAVLGDDFRRAATADEIATMAELLDDDMRHGALGLATGLEYMPGIFSATEEIVTLAKVAAKHGGRYASHVRDEDDRFLEAVDEVMRIGREAQIPVHISHIKLADKMHWGSTDTVLDRLRSARGQGIEVSADIYPYVHWQSLLAVLFPDRDYTSKETAEFTFQRTTSPETLIVTSFAPNAAYNGLTIAEIALLREQDAVSTLLELTQQSDDWLKRTGVVGDSIVAKGMNERDVIEFMHWEHTNICSDGGYGGGHPRGYGAFPRFLDRFATEETGITLESAVAKMTSISATNTGIPNRGMIRSGYFADLVLFDPDSIADRATFEQPTLLSAGVLAVWVNGEIVFKDGESTGVYAGRLVTGSGKKGAKKGAGYN